MTKDNISLDLLENGLDFIIRGLDELYVDYKDDGKRFITPVSQPQKDYKYGILHLFSGFVLLLKEKLARDTPKLIFRDSIKRIDKVNNDLTQGLTPKTVNFDEVIDRLKKLDNVENRVFFTDSDMSVIRKIQDYRNFFEHYKINNVDTVELKMVIISFIDLIDRFLYEHLQINIMTLDLPKETHFKIGTIKSIYDRIIEETKYALQGVGEYQVEKLKSNRESFLRILHEENELYYHLKNSDNERNIFDICPKCHAKTLMYFGEFTGVCSNVKCYEYTPLIPCVKCGVMIEGYDWEEKRCNNCKDKQTE